MSSSPPARPQPGFTPGQGVFCTLLGGPLAGTYVLVANARALGQYPQARGALLLGCLAALAMSMAFPSLHARAPAGNLVLPLLAAWVVHCGLLRPGAGPGKLRPASPLRVAAVCALGLIGYLVLIASHITLCFEWNLLPGV